MENQKKKQVEASNQNVPSPSANSVFMSPSSALANLNQKIADLVYDAQSSYDLEPKTIRPQIKFLLLEKLKESPKFLGILGKCKIHGCDVHLLSPSLEILNHFKIGSPIENQYQQAREVLNMKEAPIIAILIYEDRLETICIDGTVQRVS